MFEEERALKKLLEEYQDLSFKLSASKYTATLKIEDFLEVLIDPTKPTHEWLTVDLKQGTLSPVLFSDISDETRRLLLKVAGSLKTLYQAELAALEEKNEARRIEKAAQREAEKDLLKRSVSLYM
jgi:hypothetical protein